MNETELYAAPVKHSVTISGHQTSISLEPVFWAALRRAALEEGVALNALIGQIDVQRMAVMKAAPHHVPPNLASAIRCWLWNRCCAEMPQDNGGRASVAQQ